MKLSKLFVSTPSNDIEQSLATIHEAFSLYAEKFTEEKRRHFTAVESNRDWEKVCVGVRQIESRHFAETECTFLEVEMDSGSYIPRHNHAESKEIVYIVKGSFLETESGVLYKQGEIVVFPQGQYHGMESQAGSLLTVSFFPKIPA